jgi:hypothetical protein
MAAPTEKKISNVRYWRYVFTPLLLITIAFGLFMLFASSDTQVADYSSLMKKTNAFLSESTASSKNTETILQGLTKLSL